MLALDRLADQVDGRQVDLAARCHDEQRAVAACGCLERAHG
jgi:hypothetical protein